MKLSEGSLRMVYFYLIVKAMWRGRFWRTWD